MEYPLSIHGVTMDCLWWRKVSFFCERFNKSFREDVLDAYWFENIEQARTFAQDWMEDYNNYHPHASLGNCSPIEFKLKRSA